MTSKMPPNMYSLEKKLMSGLKLIMSLFSSKTDPEAVDFFGLIGRYNWYELV